MNNISTVTAQAPHQIGPITLDVECHLLTRPRGSLRLAPLTFAVIERLMRRPGVVVTRAAFMEAADTAATRGVLMKRPSYGGAKFTWPPWSTATSPPRWCCPSCRSG